MHQLLLQHSYQKKSINISIADPNTMSQTPAKQLRTQQIFCIQVIFITNETPQETFPLVDQ